MGAVAERRSEKRQGGVPPSVPSGLLKGLSLLPLLCLSRWSRPQAATRWSRRSLNLKSRQLVYSIGALADQTRIIPDAFRVGVIDSE